MQRIPPPEGLNFNKKLKARLEDDAEKGVLYAKAQRLA